MSKLYLLNVLLAAVAVIALIPLSIEIFGDMNIDVIIISARIMQVSLIGAAVCAVIRVWPRLTDKDTRNT